MKFSKMSWLILTVGIFIIGAVALYLVYQSETDEQASLNERLAAANSQIPGLATEKSELDEQLTQAEQALANAKASLAAAIAKYPTAIESTNYGDNLFEIADNLGLIVNEFVATEPILSTMDGITYESTVFNVTVSGDLDEIIKYITQIEVGADFNTSSIDVVNVEVFIPNADEPTGVSMAQIQINIIAYIGG